MPCTPVAPTAPENPATVANTPLPNRTLLALPSKFIVEILPITLNIPLPNKTLLALLSKFILAMLPILPIFPPVISRLCTAIPLPLAEIFESPRKSVLPVRYRSRQRFVALPKS